MKEFLINSIKLILSILIMIFLKVYFVKILDLLHISLSNNLIEIISLILELICIFIIYLSEIKSSFSKYKHKIGNNILYTLVSFIVLLVAMLVVNYLLKIIGNSFKVSYNGLTYYSIFNNKISLSLITTIIKEVIINPFIMVIVFGLGINNIFKGKLSPYLCGLGYTLFIGYFIISSKDYLIINLVDDFIFMVILMYIYKKNNNIVFSILSFTLFNLFAGLIINKVL